MSDPHLNSEQQTFLLKLARDSIRNRLGMGTEPPTVVEDAVLMEKRGAFVTLKQGSQLRGCIGYPLPHDPIHQTVRDAAVMAATQDHRFQPLTGEELPEVRIEISVLTLPRTITDVSEIRLGDHGLIISRGINRGLLLPQVPKEWDWDLETFLKHTCLKAGLEEDAWKKGAEIQVFSAQVFSE
jgi:AmmeMemoRadiSam system protein A